MSLFATGEARWLGVSTGKLPEQPRVLLVSVPYALKAGDAETLGGKPATSFVPVDNLKDEVRSAVQSQLADPKTGLRSLNMMVTNPTPSFALTSGTAGYIGKFINATHLGNSVMFESAGKIGLGTTSPANAPDVQVSNAGMRLAGTGTHQVVVSGTGSSGRLGQDLNGFFRKAGS